MSRYRLNCITILQVSDLLIIIWRKLLLMSTWGSMFNILSTNHVACGLPSNKICLVTFSSLVIYIYQMHDTLCLPVGYFWGNISFNSSKYYFLHITICLIIILRIIYYFAVIKYGLYTSGISI